MTIQQYPDICISNASTHSLLEASVIVSECFKETQSEYAESESEISYDRDYFYDELSVKSSNVWLAYSGREIAGVIALKGNTVRLIAVAKPFRNQSFGSLLVQTAVSYLEENGFFSVQAEVDMFNTPVIGFFKALNWIQFQSEFTEKSSSDNKETHVLVKEIGKIDHGC